VTSNSGTWIVWKDNQSITYLHTYLLIHLLHGVDSILRSYPVLS